ncbi:MAG TPA: protocatechuate 3,4-dioxygenase subunit beta [Streptosporangiaceae bacterium]|nr:protocatechuate 3,4-dioxygenase subunit beta [Streptosporangiaceae bacterium]
MTGSDQRHASAAETVSFTLPRYVSAAGVHPPLDTQAYQSSRLRAPGQPLIPMTQRLTEITGPVLGAGRVTADDADLTTGHAGEPLGERIIVSGRVLDSDGRPVPDTLIEIWQANASGRYAHRVDDHPAPLDPNFTGEGRCVTDSLGRYQFVTIKPGAYPWRNHYNAWRPAHIHFSLLGRAFTQRLVTQMYFPADPLFPLDPIFNSIPDPQARARLIAAFDIELTQPDWALGYRWDIVLRGRTATVFETPGN